MKQLKYHIQPEQLAISNRLIADLRGVEMDSGPSRDSHGPVLVDSTGQ